MVNIVSAGVTLSQDATLTFADSRRWSDWLEQNHGSCRGVWLQIAKKGSETASVTYAEALEAALCYGWIDGQKKKGPEGFWLQRFSPRGGRSIWSKVNRAKALELIETNRMRPAGLAAIENAKRNGQWEAAYDAWGSAKVPDDLARELSKDPEAEEFFSTLNAQNRYAILFRLQTAKKPETRTKRLKQFVQMLAERRTIYPQRSPN